MKTFKLIALFLSINFIISLSVKAQLNEPEFIGEVYKIQDDNSTISIDKDIAAFTSGISWSSNSWNALSIEIQEKHAQTRFSSAETLKFIVRAVDNNSDPLSIISIYKLKAKRKKRTVLISEDNSGTLMKSRTNSKDLMRFNGKKHGASSYIIELKNLKPGEYGIIVSNPNTIDEKRAIISCFGIDK